MPISSALVTRFHQLLADRQFTEAKRELLKIEERLHRTEWNRGYYRALRGMLIARRSNNENSTFFSKLDLNDRKALQDYRKEFRMHVRHRLHEDFDRGFFSAWSDCMRVLIKLAENDERSQTKAGHERFEDGENVERSVQISSENDNQAKIESFLKGRT